MLVHGTSPPHVLDFAFPFAELPEFAVGPFLQPIKVPLKGNIII